MKKIHFIAIGGSAMHSLALVLKQMGYEISGSDDTIFEPSYSKLKAAGLLPDEMGWFPETYLDWGEENEGEYNEEEYNDAN